MKTRIFALLIVALVSSINTNSFAERVQDTQKLNGTFEKGSGQARSAATKGKGKASARETSHTYAISVDYSQSVEQAVQAGNWEGHNSEGINSGDFPELQAKKGVFPAQRHNLLNTQITLIHINHKVTTQEALEVLTEKGYRPANLYELLALGAQHPDLQRGLKKIVALGSSMSTIDEGGYRVGPFSPCLGMGVIKFSDDPCSTDEYTWDYSKRNLDLCGRGDGKMNWDTLWWFAAVSTSSSR